MPYPTINLTATRIEQMGPASGSSVGVVAIQIYNATTSPAWSGSGVFRVRAPGAPDSELVDVTYINASTGSVVTAGTAVVAEGIFEVVSNGLEVVFDYTHTAGAAILSWVPIQGSGRSTSSGGGGGGGGDVNLTQVGGASISEGQKAMAASLPVVIASNQSNLNVVVASALPAGTNNIGDVDVLTLPSIPAGANAIGSVTVTSLPATPAGTNLIGGVNVAQYGGTNTTLGSKASTASAPVVIASDQVAVAVKAASGVIASGAYASGAISAGAYAAGALVASTAVDGWDVTQGLKADAAVTNPASSGSVIALLKGLITLLTPAAGTQTTAQVTVANTATSILAANASRKGLTFVNQGSAIIYIGGATVSTSTGLAIAIGAAFSDVTSTTQWYGIVATGTQTMGVCEIA